MKLGQRRTGLKTTLNQYVLMHSSIPYRFGYHDCVVFCLRWALGHIPEKAKYNSPKTALAGIKAHNTRSIDGVFDYYMERVESPLVGDIVKFDGSARWGGYGVYDGSRVLSVAHNGKITVNKDTLIIWRPHG